MHALVAVWAGLQWPTHRVTVGCLRRQTSVDWRALHMLCLRGLRCRVGLYSPCSSWRCSTHALPASGPSSPCRAWVQIVGEEATKGMSIACIGSTSARAAEKLGLQRIKVSSS